MFRNMKFSLQNTIFIKLIATFLLIMAPIVSLGVYMYNWSAASAKEDVLRTARSQLSSYLADLENEIERMKLLQYGVLEDADLNRLAFLSESMGTIEQMERINALWNRLYAIHNSSSLIRDVRAHIHPIMKTVSSASGAEALDEDRYLAILSASVGNRGQMADVGGTPTLIAVKPYGTNRDVPLVIVEIALNDAQLRGSLGKIGANPNAVTLLQLGGVAVGDAAFPGDAPLPGADGPLAWADGQGVIRMGEERYYLTTAASDGPGLVLYHFIPEPDVLEPLYKIRVLGWAFVAAVLAITGIYAFFIYRFIHRPLLKLVKSFRKLESGDLHITIEHGSNDEFRYLYGRFNQMVANLRSLIDQAYKQKIMAQRAELKQLQSQINPHFLYNSFFILNTMANTGDLEGIETFTTQLGGYFQFVTRNALDEVDLEQEIHHARLYTDIQSLRFSHRIKVEFEPLPKGLGPFKVPRLIVQPIIENAYEHSLERMVTNGLIRITFAEGDDDIRIVIEDNGDGLTDEAINRIRASLDDESGHQEITGIVNIHRRIRITYGEESGLSVSRSALGGLQVTLKLLKRRREDIHEPVADRG